MGGWLYDLKLSFRTLWATRGVAAAAILVLALGTGINTAVLAVSYGILLRPLPYPDASRIAVVSLRAAEGPDFGVPGPELDEWQRRLRAVEHLAGYSIGEFTMRGIGEPRVLRVALLRGHFFQVLGTRPAAGRWPSPREDGWVILSDRVARQLTPGRSPVGQTVTVGRGTYAVAAVMPDGFTFPAEEVGAWLPGSQQTAIGLADRADARSYRMVARLRAGATMQQLAEDGTRVVRELRPANPADRNARKYQAKAVVTTLDESLTGSVRPLLRTLSVAALLVLLVACGNVASLFVGRAVARGHDVAVRLALGASRWQLVRGILAESLVVAACAATIGVWVGYVLVRLFVRVAAGVFPRLDAVAIDLPVLAASALVAFAVALICGAAPALHTARTGFVSAFRASTTSSRPARRLRAGLAAVQIALSIVLLAGAGLVVRTVSRLLDQATGFEPRNAVSLRLVMTDATTFTATGRVAFVKQVTERVGALPGVQAAGIGSGLPPRIAPLSIGIRVVSDGRDDFTVLSLVSVTPGYLRALGARLVRGRMLRDTDMEGREVVALLSESAARHLSPRQDAVGRPLVFPLPAAVAGRNRRPQVVGVVGDIKYAGLDASSAGCVYVLWPDLPAGVGHLVVRTAGDPSTLVASLRRVVRELDPTLPLTEVRTMDDEILSSIADRRLRLIPALSFAVLALLVALVGLSASLTRAVTERRRELAIRGALGATPGRTLRAILAEGALVTAAGLCVGLGIAAALAGTLAQFLYGVTPRDPATFGVVGGVVAAASLGVCYLAARRALRVDLLELLRAE